MNVPAFLRWAGVNLLLGSWDNYFATPANYYLYNAGHKGAKDAFMDSPYFVFIPWDYDNSFGIDYFGTQWQYTDIVDWPSNTRNYWAKQGRTTRRRTSRWCTNLLRNHDLCQYYLDHLEHLLDTVFTPDKVLGADRRRGRGRTVGPGAPRRLPRGRHSVLAAVHRAPVHQRRGLPHRLPAERDPRAARRRSRASSTTSGCAATALGNSSRRCARTIPSGASGATFSGVLEPLPEHA